MILYVDWCRLRNQIVFATISLQLSNEMVGPSIPQCFFSMRFNFALRIQLFIPSYNYCCYMDLESFFISGFLYSVNASTLDKQWNEVRFSFTLNLWGRIQNGNSLNSWHIMGIIIYVRIQFLERCAFRIIFVKIAIAIITWARVFNKDDNNLPHFSLIPSFCAKNY